MRQPHTMMLTIATASARWCRAFPMAQSRLASIFAPPQPPPSLPDHYLDYGQTRLFSNTNNQSKNSDDIAHRKMYKISGTGQRSAVVMTTNTGHELRTDVPKKMGGSDAAPQPVEHLLAALLGCTQATAIYVGRMMKPRLIIDRIEFDVEAYRDERGALTLPIDVVPDVPARLQCVSGTVEVYFKKEMDVSREQLRSLAEQTEARCPVANMMHSSGCVMDLKWVVGNDDDSKE